MIRLQTKRHPFTAPLSALLLVVHASLAAITGLAHAGESITAPSGIEAQHGKACVVLHDPARCAICQLATGAVLPHPIRAPSAAIANWPRPLAPIALNAAQQLRHTARPRAPPLPPV